MHVANLMRPMSEFDPSQPAILHDQLSDRIIAWTGEHHEQFRQSARHGSDGIVEWNDFRLDGWGNPLGG